MARAAPDRPGGPAVSGPSLRHPGHLARAAKYYSDHGREAEAQRAEAQLTEAGRCKCCGRRLTDERSLAVGIGPDSAAKQARQDL